MCSESGTGSPIHPTRSKDQVQRFERVLVLGGAGLVGRALADATRPRADAVVIADRAAGPDQVPVDLTDPGGLGALVADLQPDLIFNAVNLATLFSERRAAGYGDAIRLHVELFEALRGQTGAITYVQIGTTGSGGLGFDVPFTHGGHLEDLPIIHKAAFAGINSQLLLLMARSFPSDRVRIIELKPGLAIFAPDLTVVDEAGLRAVTVDGGESGAYTRDELALLTRFMGYTTPDRVAAAALAAIDGTSAARPVTHDVVAALDQAIISQTEADRVARDAQLERMAACGEGHRTLPATGNLGPPRITRDLIAASSMLEADGAGDAVRRASLDYLRARAPDLVAWLDTQDFAAVQRDLEPFAVGVRAPWEVVYGSLRRQPR